MNLHSALRDTRFSPMKPTEMPLLKCAVSFLTNFEPAKNHEDWKVCACDTWFVVGKLSLLCTIMALFGVAFACSGSSTRLKFVFVSGGGARIDHRVY